MRGQHIKCTCTDEFRSVTSNVAQKYTCYIFTGRSSKASTINWATILDTDWFVSRYTNLLWLVMVAKHGDSILLYRIFRILSYWEHMIRKWNSFSTSFRLSSRSFVTFLHFGCRQYLRSRWTIGRVYLSDSILIGRQPSLNCANLFLRINGKHWRVYAITDSWGTKGSNSVLYVHRFQPLFSMNVGLWLMIQQYCQIYLVSFPVILTF